MLPLPTHCRLSTRSQAAKINRRKLSPVNSTTEYSCAALSLLLYPVRLRTPVQITSPLRTRQNAHSRFPRTWEVDASHRMGGTHHRSVASVSRLDHTGARSIHRPVYTHPPTVVGNQKGVCQRPMTGLPGWPLREVSIVRVVD